MNFSKIKTTLIKNELLFQVFILIVLNYLITKILYRAVSFKNIDYSNSSIFIQLFEELSLSIILFMSIPILLYKLQWKDIVELNFIFIKYFVLFVLTIWVWNIITLDFNLYFNQAYHLDRVILLILFLLSFRYPQFIIYVLILSLVFYTQVNYPSLGKIYPFPKAHNALRVLIEILILFSIYMTIKRFYKNISILAFFIVVICFHASNYFIPGLGKMGISENYFDWIWSNNLSNILPARYFYGWLAEVIPLESIGTVTNFFYSVTVPMQFFAFFTQLVVIFIFIKKRFALILLVSFELLHIGVFLASGIFFWEWILVNLSIIYVINKFQNNDIKTIFNYKIMLFSFPVLLVGNMLFHSSFLAWYDTPLNNSYQIFITTENNKVYKVDSNLFAPYELVFHSDSLNYAINKPILPRWGTNNQILHEELQALSNKKNITDLSKEIDSIEKKYGKNSFNIEKQKKLISFLKIYFQNFNKNQNKKLIWNHLSTPKHIYLSFNWDDLQTLESKVKNVDIIAYKTFYSRFYNKLIILNQKTILKIKI